MSYARRPRTAFAALALVALALSTAPVSSPAAPPSHVADPARVAAASHVAVASHVAAPSHVAASSAKPGTTKRVAAKPNPPATKKPLFSYKDAPADEYFGRLKLSILGVRSKVKDFGLDADAHPEHDAAILSSSLFVEDAMRDWARKYPYDHWLPRYAFALETMYERIPGDEAHKRARRQLNYITAYFPQTVYGKVGRAKLVDGIPTPDPSATPATELQRLALIDGKVRPTIPPVATPTPSADPNASPTESPNPPAPTASTSPAASTTTSPKPTEPATAAPNPAPTSTTRPTTR